MFRFFFEVLAIAWLISETITMQLLQGALMKRGRLLTVFTVALFMFLWTAGPTMEPSAVMPQDISLGNHAVPAASFYVKPIWDNIYDAVSTSNLQTI